MEIRTAPTTAEFVERSWDKNIGGRFRNRVKKLVVLLTGKNQEDISYEVAHKILSLLMKNGEAKKSLDDFLDNKSWDCETVPGEIEIAYSEVSSRVEKVVVGTDSLAA